MNANEPLRADTQAPLAWLTWEVALYGAVWILGMGLRFAAIGRWPLAEAGAQTALAAWRTVSGAAWRPPHYIPLLYDANLLTFYLTKATGASARLLPVLVSGWLILLPWMIRDVLGRWGALLAALLLAVAPSWALYSVAADSPILTTTATATLLVMLYRYACTKERQYALWASAVLALGLTAGPGIYTPLFVALVGIGICALASRDRSWMSGLVTQVREMPWSRMALVFVGTFVLAASGFLANLGGIGASVEQLGVWMQHLAPRSSDLAWYAYPTTLATYESLTISLAIMGAIMGAIKRRRLDLALLAWALIVLVLGTLLGHRRPMWVLDIMLPLAILAARGFDRAVQCLSPGATAPDLAVAAGGVILIVFGFLQLATYMHTAEENLLIYAGIIYGLLIVALVGYGLLGYRGSALRVGMVLVLFITGVITARATSALCFQTGRDPRERLLYHPASAELDEVRAFVLETSSRRAGDSHLLDIEYDALLDPWVGWATRDMIAAQKVDGISPTSDAAMLLTPARGTEDWPVGYVGQRFRVTGTFSHQGLTTRERLKWFFYRDPVGEVLSTDLQIWVRLPDQNSDTRER